MIITKASLLSGTTVIGKQIQICIVLTALIVREALMKYIMLLGLSYDISIMYLCQPGPQ